MMTPGQACLHDLLDRMAAAERRAHPGMTHEIAYAKACETDRGKALLSLFYSTIAKRGVTLAEMAALARAQGDRALVTLCKRAI
jgi:hypothetical protein